MRQSDGGSAAVALGPPGRALSLAAAALVLLAGCGPQTVPVELQLATASCGEGSPLEGVAWLRFRISGEGLSSLERYAPVERGAAALPEVPAGQGRVVEVRGYTALPGAGGRVVSLGRSRPFDVPQRPPAEPLRVPVALRRVGTLAPLADAARPGECVTLEGSRAAHTATLLEDGRVLLAGGFQLGLEGGPTEGVPTTLASTVLLEPVTGALEPGPVLASPRAYHSATALLGGTVLLAGGEEDSARQGPPLSSAEVLDMVQRAATRLELRVARSRHAAALEAGGRVLLAGGVGESGGPAVEAEGYDPGTGRTFPVSTPLARVGLAAAPVQGGKRILVAGGSDGAALQAEVQLLAYEGGTFVPAGPGPLLREPRREAALVPWQGTGLLLVGGSGVPEEPESNLLTLPTSEVLEVEGGARVSEGPLVGARLQPCAVALSQGQVLVAGGRGPSGTATSEVDLILPTQAGVPVVLGMPRLQRPRWLHTCTGLADGSVLLVGGLDDSTSPPATLGDVLLYVPPPLD